MKKHIISVTIAGLFMLLAIYFATLYLTDQREVSRFLDKVTESPGFYGEALSDYSYLIQIRDNVVAKISLDKTKLGRRKPWGYRVSTIIRKQSGQCGEVTRLLINLLHRLHIPSRRVTLLGKDFMHAVIEANVGGRWVLIDTTNSPMHFKEIVTHNPRSILEYFLKPLGKKIYTFSVVEEFQQLEITYFTYFYNLNSILHLFGLHIYIVKPLPVWLYFLLENPPLYAAWICFIAANILILSVIIGKRKQRKNDSH